jgi:O-antigen/teichoic acid export membrane protein
LAGLSPVLVAIALFAVFTLLREYWRRFLMLKGWMGYLFAIDGGVALTQVAALIVIIYLGEATAATAHAAIGLVCACFALPLWFIFRKDYDVSTRSIWPDFKDNIQIGGWLLFNSVLWSIGGYAYPWMLAMMHGPQATGIWSACMSVIAFVGIALAGILNVLTPRIARARADGGAADFRRYINKACRNYAAFALLLACIPVVFGEKIISLVYGSAYSGTHLIISVLALNAVFGAVTGCFGRGLMVIGRANWDFFLNIGTLVIVFTFGWWSTEMYGPLGAAIGLTAANGIATLMRFIAFEWFSQPRLLAPRST